MLAVQTNADPELLTLLFRNTTPDSTQSEKIRAIAKKRLAHFHYDTEYEIKDELKKELECIVFYPESFHDYFLKTQKKPSPPIRAGFTSTTQEGWRSAKTLKLF